jgi:hypothetical protein
MGHSPAKAGSSALRSFFDGMAHPTIGQSYQGGSTCELTSINKSVNEVAGQYRKGPDVR